MPCHTCVMITCALFLILGQVMSRDGHAQGKKKAGLLKLPDLKVVLSRLAQTVFPEGSPTREGSLLQSPSQRLHALVTLFHVAALNPANDGLLKGFRSLAVPIEERYMPLHPYDVASVAASASPQPLSSPRIVSSPSPRANAVSVQPLLVSPAPASASTSSPVSPFSSNHEDLGNASPSSSASVSRVPSAAALLLSPNTPSECVAVVSSADHLPFLKKVFAIFSAKNRNSKKASASDVHAFQKLAHELTHVDLGELLTLLKTFRICNETSRSWIAREEVTRVFTNVCIEGGRSFMVFFF
jgi:hypothetical protein